MANPQVQSKLKHHNPQSQEKAAQIQETVEIE
jgi:hypothetical protein